MKQIDRIRNMNAEELAELLSDCKNHCVYYNRSGACYGTEYKCKNGIHIWLESEVEE